MSKDDEYVYLLDEAAVDLKFEPFKKQKRRLRAWIPMRPRQRPWRCRAGGKHFYEPWPADFPIIAPRGVQVVYTMLPRCRKCGRWSRWRISKQRRAIGVATYTG